MAGRERAAGRTPARGRGRAGNGAAGRPPADGDLTARRAQLRDVIGPVVAAAGYDLEELAVSRAGRRHVVRVVVDGDAGVSLDAAADLSRDLSAALDAEERARGDLIAGEYVLEVSSPGVDRPLTQPRHWRRNVGRLVAVRAAGDRLTGRISEADDERVTLDVAGTPRQFGYADLGPGRVQVEFSRLDELADEDEDPDELSDHDEEEDEE
jgi:ribosome maturation factor RimP